MKPAGNIGKLPPAAPPVEGIEGGSGDTVNPSDGGLPGFTPPSGSTAANPLAPSIPSTGGAAGGNLPMLPAGFIQCENLGPADCKGPAAEPGRFCMWHSRDLKCHSGDPNSPEDFCAQIDNMGDCNAHQSYNCCWDRGQYCDKFDAGDCGVPMPGLPGLTPGMSGGMPGMSNGMFMNSEAMEKHMEAQKERAEEQREMNEEMNKQAGMQQLVGLLIGGGGATGGAPQLQKASPSTQSESNHSNVPYYALAGLGGLLLGMSSFIIFNQCRNCRKSTTSGLLANAV